MSLLPREAFEELHFRVTRMLETYANVHRGSGHNSQTTTKLYEECRTSILNHLGYRGRRADRTAVVFCTPRQADRLAEQLKPGRFRRIASSDIGLPLGVTALAVPKSDLPSGAPRVTGGGTARLVGPTWAVWSRVPDRFEPGTPSVVNVYAWTLGLEILRESGHDTFQPDPDASGAALSSNTDRLSGFTGPALLEALRSTLVGRDLQVATNRGQKPYIHLDNAASTRTFEPIWKAAWQAWGQSPAGQQALVAETKRICAEVFGAPAPTYEVVFTANTTEAMNLVAENLALSPSSGVRPVVVNTLLEHNSNELPWRGAFDTLRLGVDDQGFWDPRELERLLAAYNEEDRHPGQRIALVAVSGASNVLGTCNELGPLAALAHRYGARLLVDAAQLAAHRGLNLEHEAVDYLVFSGHKVYAPFGTGVLMVRKDLLAFDPAERERIRASGEANVGGIAALGTALSLLGRIGFETIQAEEADLTRRLLEGLSRLPGVTVYGVTDPGSPQFARRLGVLSFSHQKLFAYQITQALAEAGLGTRGGCHCAHLLVKRLLGISPGLERFQRAIVSLFPRLELPGVARLSLGLENTPAHVEACLTALAETIPGETISL